MIPFKDDNRKRVFPFVTLGLVAANAGVFARLLFLPEAELKDMLLRLAVVPYQFTHVPAGDWKDLLAVVATLFTSMFVHAGWIHLLGNVLYLWIFGDDVEEMLGHGRFALFFLICGLVAAGSQIAAQPQSRAPMVGASGAIAGILGAYLVLFPTSRVHTFVFVRIVPLPALIVLGFWLLIQLISAGPGGGGGVAWFAHLGGFVAGVLLVAPFRVRRPRQALF
ncbi:MAG TPA: rhomboid family intramembrane serine protease [Candidatus Polarisedimenticolia bacterium]|nr:rhomboid family intramembrane serine protease [Candidatus Polarisedimenticolia bacterium]